MIAFALSPPLTSMLIPFRRKTTGFASAVGATVAAGAVCTLTSMLRIRSSSMECGFSSPGVFSWAKHIFGVLICGALIALGNWIYTLFSSQWSQAGMPDLPSMIHKPGGGANVSQNQSRMGLGGTAAQQTRTTGSPDWLHEYRD